MSQAPKPKLFTAANPTVTRIVPELAVEIGLNESIMLMQIAFWIEHCENYHDDQWWTFQSVRDMQEKAFPYWSVMTINRAVKSLEDQNCIVTGNYNARKYDKTRWFALNVNGLKKLQSIEVRLEGGEKPDLYQNDTGLYQSGTRSNQNDTRSNQIDTTIPETPTETPTVGESEAVPKPHMAQAQTNDPARYIQAQQLIMAWKDATDEKVQPGQVFNPTRTKAANALLDRQVTPDEVRGCTHWRLPKKRTGPYRFNYLTDDMDEYRAYASQQRKQDAQQADMDARIAVEIAARNALVLGDTDEQRQSA